MLKARILYNNIFLIDHLNYKIDRPKYGFFKITNDLADYKKLFVILILIQLHAKPHKRKNKTVNNPTIDKKEIIVKPTYTKFGKNIPHNNIRNKILVNNNFQNKKNNFNNYNRNVPKVSESFKALANTKITVQMITNNNYTRNLEL
jgi:CRISPR/Cas system-associated endonuclease Cas3-HD